MSSHERSRGHSEFEELMRRAKAGEEEAAAELVSRFQPDVYRSIRRRILRKMRRVTTSDDIAQSVWRSFFVGCRQSFASPRELAAFLRRLASNKTIDRGRKHNARKRVNASTQDFVIDSLHSREPRPSEVLMAEECASQLARSVPVRFVEAVRLCAQGASVNEAAKSLGVPKRSLYRAIEQAREKFER